MKLVTVCCLLVCGLSAVSGARILAMLPMPGKSHFIYCQSVLAALSARGHQITLYSPFPPKADPNIKHVEIHTQFEDVMKNSWTFDSFKSLTNTKSYFGCGGMVIWHLSYAICEEVLQNQKIKELIRSKEKYDLVIMESLFGEEALVVFGHLFNAPVVDLAGFAPWSVPNRIFGNALQIASYPDPASFAFSSHMSFIERFRNFVSVSVTLSLYYLQHLPKHDDIIKRTLNDPTIPPITDLVSNISLTLANFHPTVSHPIAFPPNMVPVAGIHVAKDPAPLPKDIKAFMDSGKNAVIYFSLGTVVPVHLMPPEYTKIFTNVFRRLPYKVLWKTEAESIPDLPSNVMVAKWLPQQSVLAHPNCVLFITHGGMLSQVEVFHAGMPVVGIPFFGDQPFNVRLYEELGVGVKLDFSTLTEESMYKAINSVVGKPEYVKNAKKVSELFHHRPMSAADTAVFWVEYVMRHGAEHLRPAGATLSWYQLALLDILGAILVALIVVILIIRKVLSLLCGLCCGAKNTTITSKKKKN